jgi:methyl-accepting chemotaxis protein
VIVQSISDSSEQMNQNASEVDKLANKSTIIEERILNTANMIEHSLVISKTGLDNSIKFSVESSKVTEMFENINTLSKSNSTSIDNISTTIGYMEDLISKLNSKVNQFKT